MSAPRKSRAPMGMMTRIESIVMVMPKARPKPGSADGVRKVAARIFRYLGV